jgi:hypothetical protein
VQVEIGGESEKTGRKKKKKKKKVKKREGGKKLKDFATPMPRFGSTNEHPPRSTGEVKANWPL